MPWLGTNQLTFTSSTNGVHRDVRRGRRTSAACAPTLTRDVSWGELRGGLDIQGGHLVALQAGFGHKGDKVHVENGDTTIDWVDLALWTETRVRARRAVRGEARRARSITTG